MVEQRDHLNQPILSVSRTDVTTLYEDLTVQQALDDIRLRGVGDKIVYFYVIDRDDRLVGVIPTRRLLTAPLEQLLSKVMVRRVMAIPQSATVLEACEFFLLHKFLAFPVVDEQRHIRGVVDVTVLTEEVFDLEERERIQELFETIGFRLSQVRGASPRRAFRFRFPWLLATICSGTICALLSSIYELTLAKSLVLAFFLTLMLGLGESVSMQSMTLTIHTLRSLRPTLRWYVQAFRREVGTALLLGGACSIVVSLIVLLWRGKVLEAVTIGSSILLVLFAACLIGLSAPALLHALKLDLKVAAGPVTLAVTDIFTILFYFGLAAALL